MKWQPGHHPQIIWVEYFFPFFFQRELFYSHKHYKFFLIEQGFESFNLVNIKFV